MCVVVGHIDEIDLLVLDLGNDGGHVIIGDSNVVFGNDLRAELGSLRLEVGGLLLAEVEINGNDGNAAGFQLADSKLRGSGSLDRTGEGLGEDEVACIDNVRVNGIGGDHHDTGILADGSGNLGGAGVGTGYDSVNIIHGSKLFQNVGRFRRIQTVIVVDKLDLAAVDAARFIDQLDRKFGGLLGALAVSGGRGGRNGSKEADANGVGISGITVAGRAGILGRFAAAGNKGKDHSQRKNETQQLFHGCSSS